MNILLPMAGKGRRFAEAGYRYAKPYIDVAGRPMFSRVLDNLPAGNLIVIPPGFGDDRGAAATVLTRSDDIDNDEPLMIANCDQIVDWDPDEFVRAGTTGDSNGAVAVFDCPNRDSKWSYITSMEGGWVHGIVEKPADPPTTLATCGIYLWRRGSDFVKFANQMIDAEDRVNGEFYIAPVYNYAIQAGWNIKAYGVRRMLGMGTPEDLKETIRVLESEA